MNIKNMVAVFSFVALCSSSLSTQSASLNRTVDGRFNSLCKPWIGDISKELCLISFYKLIAKPEKYDGKLIRVSGLIIKISGQLVLFPNRESYEANVDVEGIAIVTDANVVFKNVRGDLDKGVFPVAVVGVFDAKYGGAGSLQNTFLGALRGGVVTGNPRIREGGSDKDLENAKTVVK